MISCLFGGAQGRGSPRRVESVLAARPPDQDLTEPTSTRSIASSSPLPRGIPAVLRQARERPGLGTTLGGITRSMEGLSSISKNLKRKGYENNPQTGLLARTRGHCRAGIRWERAGHPELSVKQTTTLLTIKVLTGANWTRNRSKSQSTFRPLFNASATGGANLGPLPARCSRVTPASHCR